MCWKKIAQWFKPDPILPPITSAERRLLTFGKNKYGGGNDLNGCVNDSNNLSSKLGGMFSDLVVYKYLDYEVTAIKFIIELGNAVRTLKPGGTVVVLADCCFAESNTKFMRNNPHPTKSRFYDTGLPPRKKKKKVFTKNLMKWIAISGCQDHQTSADAYINGSYQGAFTFYAIKCLKAGMTYKQWFEAIKKEIAGKFDQIPTLEGPDHLINRVVGEGETLFIHISSHGSYTYDKNGDEEDGQDEGPHFDRLVVDDEIGIILDKISS